MTEPLQETLAKLDQWIHDRKEQVHPRTDNQQKMDRWKERMKADPVRAMRDTERMLWAIHDRDGELNTSDPAGVGGYQLYTWVTFMVAARRTKEDLYQWVMQALDTRRAGIGMVHTSEGWLGVGAVIPSKQNHLVPIDVIEEIDGTKSYVMAHKAVPTSDGRGVRLVSFHPDLMQPREDALRARLTREEPFDGPGAEAPDVEAPVEATGQRPEQPDAGRRASDLGLRPSDGGRGRDAGVRVVHATSGQVDIPTRMLREAIERVNRADRDDPYQPRLMERPEEADR